MRSDLLVLAAAAAGAVVADLFVVVNACATGVPGIDRLGVLMAQQALIASPLSITGQKLFARTLATLAYNETGGNTDAPVVGDSGLSYGPSIGPWQVLRKTAKEEGLWTPSAEAAGDEDLEIAEYTELAENENACASLAGRLLRRKLQQAGGDWSLVLQRWNGSGPNARAYQARALDFQRSRGWA